MAELEIPKRFDPVQCEDRWYGHWMRKGYFRSVPDDREPYTVVIPPPNVTGVLHMGHMLNNTIQDVLVRRARMQGKNACWVPGTDHASIATEAKVVRLLGEQGIKKSAIGREVRKGLGGGGINNVKRPRDKIDSQNSQQHSH